MKVEEIKQVVKGRYGKFAEAGGRKGPLLTQQGPARFGLCS